MPPLFEHTHRGLSHDTHTHTHDPPPPAPATAMPIYMHYRWVQWQAHNRGWTEEQEEAAYEELHNR